MSLIIPNSAEVTQVAAYGTGALAREYHSDVTIRSAAAAGYCVEYGECQIVAGTTTGTLKLAALSGTDAGRMFYVESGIQKQASVTVVGGGTNDNIPCNALADLTLPKWVLYELDTSQLVQANQGTAGANPVPPNPTTGRVVIARVLIPAGATGIPNATFSANDGAAKILDARVDKYMADKFNGFGAQISQNITYSSAGAVSGDIGTSQLQGSPLAVEYNAVLSQTAPTDVIGPISYSGFTNPWTTGDVSDPFQLYGQSPDGPTGVYSLTGTSQWNQTSTYSGSSVPLFNIWYTYKNAAGVAKDIGSNALTQLTPMFLADGATVGMASVADVNAPNMRTEDYTTARYGSAQSNHFKGAFGWMSNPWFGEKNGGQLDLSGGSLWAGFMSEAMFMGNTQWGTIYDFTARELWMAPGIGSDSGHTPTVTEHIGLYMQPFTAASTNLSMVLNNGIRLLDLDRTYTNAPWIGNGVAIGGSAFLSVGGTQTLDFANATSGVLIQQSATYSLNHTASTVLLNGTAQDNNTYQNVSTVAANLGTVNMISASHTFLANRNTISMGTSRTVHSTPTFSVQSRTTVARGHTTLNSTTITHDNSVFTAGDVGSIITGTNIPSGTTIVSVTNATTAVMSAQATANSTPGVAGAGTVAFTIYYQDSVWTGTNNYVAVESDMSVGPGALLTNRYGFKFNDATAGPTRLTNQYGVYIPVMLGAANNHGIWNASTTVWPGTSTTLSGATSPINVAATQVVLNNTSGGALTLTSTNITAGGADGEFAWLVNTSANTVTLQDSTKLAGSKLKLQGAETAILPQYGSMPVMWNSTLSQWLELGRGGIVADGRVNVVTNSLGVWTVRKYAAQNTVLLERVNGTIAAPSKILSGQTIASIQFSGGANNTAATPVYSGTVQPAYFQAVSTQDWDTSNQGVLIEAWVTPTSSATAARGFILDQNGSFGVGTATTAAADSFFVTSAGAMTAAATTITGAMTAASTLGVTGTVSLHNSNASYTASQTFLQATNSITYATTASMTNVFANYAPATTWSVAPAVIMDTVFANGASYINTAASNINMGAVWSFLASYTKTIDTQTGKSIGGNIDYQATPTFTTANSGTFTSGSWKGALMSPTMAGSSSNVMSAWTNYDASGTITLGTVTAWTNFNTSGTVASSQTATTVTGFNHGAYAVAGTISTLNGVKIANATGAGTVTTQIGIDIASLTKGGTNIGIRSSASVVVNAAVGLGYAAGAGGAVTQLTNKTTAFPTINASCGTLTWNNFALGASAAVTSASSSNSVIAVGDVVIFNHISGGTLGSYTMTCTPGAGTWTLTLRNVSTGSLSEAPVFAFAIIKAATS